MYQSTSFVHELKQEICVGLMWLIFETSLLEGSWLKPSALKDKLKGLSSRVAARFLDLNSSHHHVKHTGPCLLYCYESATCWSEARPASIWHFHCYVSRWKCGQPLKGKQQLQQVLKQFVLVMLQVSWLFLVEHLHRHISNPKLKHEVSDYKFDLILTMEKTSQIFKLLSTILLFFLLYCMLWGYLTSIILFFKEDLAKMGISNQVRRQ